MHQIKQLLLKVVVLILLAHKRFTHPKMRGTNKKAHPKLCLNVCPKLGQLGMLLHQNLGQQAKMNHLKLGTISIKSHLQKNFMQAKGMAPLALMLLNLGYKGS